MPDSPTAPERTVIVGVDGSDSSVAALRWACDLASSIGSSIEVVTTWHWPMSLGAAIPIPTGYDPADDAQKLVDEVVATVAEAYPTAAIRTRVVEGNPSLALVEASKHAALLVVGSRGHAEFAGLLLGSVSQHCAAHAACPVLIYRDRIG
jgi:nucleotide-binding universal stress UspA family protein